MITAIDFTILADESTDEADRSQLALFVRYVDTSDNLPKESFLGIVKIGTSKTAEALQEIIQKFLEKKKLDISNIKFTGLDGTNAMSGERKGLQRRIRHLAPYSIYLNCSNHRLALCLVHLIKKYDILLSLDKLLISVWKHFKYSSVKQAVFEEAQKSMEQKPLKILKACTTRWLTHGETCNRIVSRFESLIDALDTLFFEKRDPESKGIRDLLLDSQMILMLLLLAEVLAPVNTLSRILQTRNLNFLLLEGKFNRLLASLEKIKATLPDHDAVDSTLKYFNNATKFLTLAVERAQLTLQTRSKVVVASTNDINATVNTFLTKIANPFIDDMIHEIRGLIEENNPLLSEFDAFNPDSTSVEERATNIDHLCEVYGKELRDTYQGHTNISAPIVNNVECTAERDEFFIEFDEATSALKSKIQKLANQKLKSNEIEANKLQEFIANNSPTSADVYQYMCKQGCLLRYPHLMRLFRLALLIPPSTSNVERGFSAMNLLCSPLRTSLNEDSLDRFMRINLMDQPNLTTTLTIGL